MVTKKYHTITFMKGCSPGMTTTINVGTIGHIDLSNAQRVAAAIRQIKVNMVVTGESFHKLGDALGKLEIYDEFVSDECPYVLEMIEDVKVKPQPFWTQQGRRKKGGRGKY